MVSLLFEIRNLQEERVQTQAQLSMADGQIVTWLHLGGLALFQHFVCAQGETSTLELSHFHAVHIWEALLLNNQFHSATVKGYHICHIACSGCGQLHKSFSFSHGVSRKHKSLDHSLSQCGL